MKPGRPRKSKGRAFEVEVVKSIFGAFPQLQEADISARIMGDAGIDVLLSNAARATLPLAIECKRVNRLENLDLKGAMKQAEANAPPDLTPVVVYREDRHEILATLRLSSLMGIIRHQNMGEYRPEILVTLKWADLLKLFGASNNDG